MTENNNGGNGPIQIDIGVRQEKACAICGRKDRINVDHTLQVDSKNKIPKLIDKMVEIAENEPCFQVCRHCRKSIMEPSYTVSENGV